MLAKILVIVENSLQALRLRQVLEGAGFSVSVARTGQHGIFIATQCPPDAVVLDTNLPDMDGYMICKIMKAHPATAYAPVIMLNSKDKAWDILASLQAGAKAHIAKDGLAEIKLLHTLQDLGITIAVATC